MVLCWAAPGHSLSLSRGPAPWLQGLPPSFCLMVKVAGCSPQLWSASSGRFPTSTQKQHLQAGLTPGLSCSLCSSVPSAPPQTRGSGCRRRTSVTPVGLPRTLHQPLCWPASGCWSGADQGSMGPPPLTLALDSRGRASVRSAFPMTTAHGKPGEWRLLTLVDPRVTDVVSRSSEPRTTRATGLGSILHCQLVRQNLLI